MCNNNCCMCCNCNTNTNNEETTQEVVYTSVCNSDTCQELANQCLCCNCCNCEKYKGNCEDDPENMILALQEHMEECCQTVGERLDTLECDLEREEARSKGKDTEHDNKIGDLYQRESIDVNYVEYVDSSNPRVIKFWHKYPVEDDKADLLIYTINVEPFLKDGILDSVDLESDGHTLHFVWNTDAGKQDSHVDMDRLVQPIATSVNNLKNSVTGYNPELPYDGTAVTVGQIDGKQFRVHLATFPTLVQSVTSDPSNNRIAVTSNKGETTYVPIENSNYLTTTNAASTYLTKTDAANTYLNQSTASNTYLTKSEALNTYQTIASDANTYPVSGSVSNHQLTLTMNNGNTVGPIALPDDDHNYYVNSATLGSNNVLTLGRTGGLSDVTVDLSSLANGTDNDHYPTSASLSGNTLTISGNSGFSPITVDLSSVSGTTNVTYGGNSVSLQNAIDGIVSRLNALEGLWEINPNDSTQVVAKNGRSAKAAGFYDSTVS